MNGLMPATGQRRTRSTVASDLQMEIRERNAKRKKMRPLESDALILVRNQRQKCHEASRVRKTKKNTDELNKHKGF